MHLMFGDTCMCEYIFMMMQVKSKSRNPMADETLDNSLWLATTNIGTDIYRNDIHRHLTGKDL